MNHNQFDFLVRSAPFGYSYNEILMNENQVAIDFICKNSNSKFAEFVFLNSEKTIGKTGSQIFLGETNDVAKLFKIIFKIAINGGSENTDFFFKSSGKWASIYVNSNETNYFHLIINDISKTKINERA